MPADEAKIVPDAKKIHAYKDFAQGTGSGAQAVQRQGHARFGLKRFRVHGRRESLRDSHIARKSFGIAVLDFPAACSA
jgi:hypothetical protein